MIMDGRRVGSYRIESLLGFGTTGTVYRAVRLDGDESAAVKIIDAEKLSKSAREQFLRHVEAARSLRHPNIVEIAETGEVGRHLYVATELFEHGSLGTLLDRARGTGQPLPLDLGLELIKQAAEGIGFAHENGVVHGDLKPENLLLKSSTESRAGAHWIVKIADFGIASIAASPIDPASNQSETEANRAVEHTPSARDDVFALGAILYEIATSRPPSTARTGSGERRSVTPPSRFSPSIPIDLDSIIVRCLSPDPADRFANGSELAAALGAASRSGTSGASGISIDAKQSAALEVDAMEYRLSLSQAGEASIDLHISNRSDEAIDVRIEVESTEFLTFPDLPRLLRLDVGQRKSISVKVRLDADHPPLPGEYRVQLQVRPTYAEATVVDVPIAIIVDPETTTRLDLQHVGRESSRRVVYHATITNDGDRLEHVSLQGRDRDHRLHFRFRPEMVTIEPGRSRTIRLEVTDRLRRSGADYISFEVTAHPSTGPSAITAAEFVRQMPEAAGTRRALVGFGALGTMAVVLAVVLLASFMRGGSSHAIAEVSTPTATLSPTTGSTVEPTIVPSPTPTEPAPTPTPTVVPTPTVAPSTDTPIAVKQVATNTSAVAITFSIGDDPTSVAKVESILALLNARNVVASFGVSGIWAEAHPDLIRQIVEGGNQLINETYDHTSFTGRSAPDSATSTAARVEELTRADQIFKQITGVSTAPYYRPPYGDIDSGANSSVERDAATAGYSVAVLWSIDTMSWSSSQTVGKMIASASKAKPGDIILFSIAPAGGDKDVSALPQVIDNLRSTGHTFATVKDLVGR